MGLLNEKYINGAESLRDLRRVLGWTGCENLTDEQAADLAEARRRLEALKPADLLDCVRRLTGSGLAMQERPPVNRHLTQKPEYSQRPDHNR